MFSCRVVVACEDSVWWCCGVGVCVGGVCVGVVNVVVLWLCVGLYFLKMKFEEEKDRKHHFGAKFATEKVSTEKKIARSKKFNADPVHNQSSSTMGITTYQTKQGSSTR
jgi:hypothetical protein